MAMAVAAILASFLLCAVAVRAADHVVGGSAGWQQGQSYNSWASDQTFRVGDNLVFNYAPNHNVNEVDKNGYDNCDANGTPRTGGSSTIPLTTPGTKYYICSVSDHCSAGGMKLAITVQAAAGSPTTPPPSGSPPSTTPSPPSSTPNTPPSSGESPPSPPSSPSPSDGAAGSFGSQGTLVVGFSLVVATLFALLG